MSGNTYYMLGMRIVQVHEMATNIKQDYMFLMSDPDTNIIGQHYNKERWMLDREAYIKEYDDYVHAPHGSDTSAPFAFNSMGIVHDDHPLVKVILMHELIGAI